jgi:hypothetical protein
MRCTRGCLGIWRRSITPTFEAGDPKLGDRLEAWEYSHPDRPQKATYVSLVESALRLETSDRCPPSEGRSVLGRTASRDRMKGNTCFVTLAERQ